VDQMRPDYLSRFDHLYTGGFRRLLDSGFVFPNGFHNHALTETAAGHAAISTGCYPSRNGITGNSWYDRALHRSFYCVEDSTVHTTGKPSGAGRSPVTMKSMTLGDWVFREDHDSKTYSIALKDRAAVEMAGFRAKYAFWYDRHDGTFVTSLYYDAIYPDWLTRINENGPTQQYYSGVWDRLLPESDYKASRADDFPYEADGKATTFPHSFLPGPKENKGKYYENILDTPFADRMVLQVAKSCVANENLGADDDVDLLWIGCSAADYVGHDYGPFSQEVEDYYLRLDGYLGDFFDFLDSLRGAGSYVVALTSDHGVLPIPEYLEQQGIASGRLDPDSVKSDIRRIGAQIEKEMNLTASPILAIDRGVILDDSVITASRADRRRVEINFAAELRKLPYIEDVYTPNDLTEEGPVREYQQQYRNSYYPGRSADLMIRYKKYLLLSGWPTGTSHGSCYDYDTDVPLVFYGPGVRAGRSSQRVETVCVAPTVGELIGYPAHHEIDGKSLVPYLRK